LKAKKQLLRKKCKKYSINGNNILIKYMNIVNAQTGKAKLNELKIIPL